MEVKLAPCVVYKDCVSCFWVVHFRQIWSNRIKSLFQAIFAEKGWILKNLAYIICLPEKLNQNRQQYFFCFQE